MFCIKCGKQAEIGYLCKPCYAGGKSLFSVKDFTLAVCPRCAADAEETVKKAVAERMVKSKAKIVSMQIKMIGSAAVVTVEAEGGLVKKREKAAIRVRIKERLCDRCSKISGNYYEAVLQARGMKKEEIFQKMREALPARAITGISQRDEGYDVRVVKKGEAAKVAKALGARYNLIRSFKLAGQKEGRKLYRSVYVIR